MSNTNLQGRIEQCTLEGRSFLGKIDGPLNIKDGITLARGGLMSSIYALLIDDVRDIARQNGVKLGHDVKYSEAMDTLRGTNSEYRITRLAGLYFLSMYYFNTPEGREDMKGSLMNDLVERVPYAGNILVTILDLENKSSSSNHKYG